MRILTTALVAALPAVAFASTLVAQPDDANIQVIRFCEHPETGEQVELKIDGSDSCPDGFVRFDDLTPAHVEIVEDIPPPLLMTHEAEMDAHAP